jgi:hypothetical protein
MELLNLKIKTYLLGFQDFVNKNISSGCAFTCFIFDGQTRIIVQGGAFVKQFYRASHVTQFSALLAGTNFIFTVACFSVTELRLFCYILEREAVLSLFL